MFGEAVEPALKKALKTTSSTEVRAQVGRLLAWLLAEREGASGAWLRPLRAVEALEYAGTAEARDLLAKLSGGAPEARLTWESKASLNRLTRRAARHD